MNAVTNFRAKTGALRERALAWWLGRTDQERKFLTVGGAVVLVALVYGLLLAPALEGRDNLRRSLPALRQQAAQLQSMAAEAQSLAASPAPQVPPMTAELLNASMAQRGLKAGSLTMTGEYAKLQFNAVSFANLVSWLDAQRRENRVQVQDATFTALAAEGQVDATLTLRQASATAQ
ncbi:type II secretion system protein M [Massilia sp. IC2-477]|uniref:type II secretion system protein GspM n=1 Tax=unclassified Massilia TaxID=2609279 RepID=UPI001D0F58F4|nr:MULTISPECIES: type II secretion system protein M [unclassified Massilia]MCC2955144.1 type II secretion system protein M [Massilia sp. IC2-477]MCC2974637.1 type II secretion system protein M [Massilia sp. IC2-476]